MPSSIPSRVVAIDATVLINLTHVGRLDLLGSLPGLAFVAPDHVVAEITVPGQRQQLDEALATPLTFSAYGCNLFVHLWLHGGQHLPDGAPGLSGLKLYTKRKLA